MTKAAYTMYKNKDFFPTVGSDFRADVIVAIDGLTYCGWTPLNW